MDTFLRCQLSPGMFSVEAAVRGTAADGTEFSLFVPRDFIECDQPISDSSSIDGWLRVKILDQADDLTLVRLPGQAFENGETVTVKDSEVEQRPRREPA